MSVRPTINVTPLIDVLLVLLIVFMIIAPTKAQKLETKVPQKPVAAPDQPPPDLLMVVVRPDGSVDLNSTPMALDVMAASLTSALEQRQDRTVFIKAPCGIKYQNVVEVVDAVKMSGASPIGLQTDFLEEDEAR